jgi:hypothetical protein
MDFKVEYINAILMLVKVVVRIGHYWINWAGVGVGLFLVLNFCLGRNHLKKLDYLNMHVRIASTEAVGLLH